MFLKTAFQLLSPAGKNARLSILIFHRVLPQPDPLFPDESDHRRFDQVMSWVAKWFHVLPLGEAVNRLRDGRLPAAAAVITFDDGYADNLTHALPVLQRYGLPATFFISTGFLDGGRMWNDSIIEAVRATELPQLDADMLGLGAVPLANVEQRRRAVHQLLTAAKHLPPVQRDEVVAQIVMRCGASLPTDLMLTSDQVRALHDAGMTIGAHTVNHPILAATTEAEAMKEIRTGKEYLENLLNQPVRLFAYPNGKPGSDYRPLHVDMVRKLGFDAAVSTHWGANSNATDPHQLLRFTPWDRTRSRYGLRLLRNLRGPDNVPEQR